MNWEAGNLPGRRWRRRRRGRWRQPKGRRREQWRGCGCDGRPGKRRVDRKRPAPWTWKGWGSPGQLGPYGGLHPLPCTPLKAETRLLSPLCLLGSPTPTSASLPSSLSLPFSISLFPAFLFFCSPSLREAYSFDSVGQLKGLAPQLDWTHVAPVPFSPWVLGPWATTTAYNKWYYGPQWILDWNGLGWALVGSIYWTTTSIPSSPNVRVWPNPLPLPFPFPFWEKYTSPRLGT